MRKFFILTADDREDVHCLARRELGKTDVKTLWSGKRLSEPLPSDVKLWIEGDVPCDFLVNPISWPIFSERFVNTAWEMIRDDVQLLEAPLFDAKTGEAIQGYRIVNLLGSVDAAVVEAGRKVSDVQYLTLTDSKIPPDFHFFRLGGAPTRLIASGELVKVLKAARMVGIAYLKTTTV